MGDVPNESAARPSRRGLVGAWLAPLAFLAIWFAPLPLEVRAHRLAAIFVAVIVLWVSEAIPIAATALLIAPAMIACGVTDESAAFAPYASPLLYLFVGGFMIARSMTRHGLDRRLALGLASMRGIAGSPARIRAAFVLTGMVLSMWISNTATTAILIPIFLGFAGNEDTPARARATTGGILTIAYACSIGGLGTPVGSPPNLIAMGFLREEGIAFEFVDWVAIGLPAALILSLAMLALFHWRYPESGEEGATVVKPAFGPWSRAERVTALSFGLAVVGWMVPGLLKAAGHPWGAPLEEALPGGAVALIATVPLFAFPARTGSPERVLPWPEAARIDWGIILLFGGGISLGRQMFDTGLAAALAGGFVGWTGVSDPWVLTAVVIVFTIFFTEVCSNTATSNMLSPLVIAIAHELEVSPIPPVLGVGLAASCAFMLPIATGPNAIAYGTGRVPQGAMLRAGFALNLICAALIFVILRILTPLMGWT